jgi:UDP-glucose 4-epimerase
MTILFTGASSFTGYWFVKELINEGYHVKAIFTKKSIDEYQGIRNTRVRELVKICDVAFDCKFGDHRFIKLIESSGNIDLLCHHAAEVKNYKSEDFDIYSAFHNNTLNIKLVLPELLKKNCNKILLTGSVFENDEGDKDIDMRAFSPYALSKNYTFQTFRYYCNQSKISLGKFVIPNPFGPFEEERFTNYLVKNWMNKQVPVINTPDYIRDNIHVDLLAKTYSYFVKSIQHSEKPLVKINPSGYVESQGAFTNRFSNEMQKRLHLDCRYSLAKQVDFNEPLRRVNFEKAADFIKNWNEEKAWDILADYYSEQFSSKK